MSLQIYNTLTRRKKKPRNTLKLRKYLTAIFFLSLFVNILPVGNVVAGEENNSIKDFSTPAKAAETLVMAARNNDVSLWAECMSRIDHEMVNIETGDRTKAELLKRKQYDEKETGKILGKDVYEYSIAQFIIDLNNGQYGGSKTSYNPFDLMFIRNECIWNNQYAEVILVLPLSVHGGFGPIKLSFINEDGKWKLLMGLSTGLIMLQPETPADLNDFVNFYLELMAGIKIDRNDAKILKKREFKISGGLSKKYSDAWSSSEDDMKDYLLLFWKVTGDKAADTVKPTNKGVFGNIPNDAYKKLTEALLSDGTGIQPISTDELIKKHHWTVEKPLTEVQVCYLRVKDNFFLGVMGFNKFIQKFPQEKKWCAKAQIDIGNHYESTKEYEMAATAYKNIIDNYPYLTDDIITAKTHLAKLYWDNLEKQDQANTIWRELDKIGKLPKDAPYSSGKTAVPKTLLKDEEKYRLHLLDFEIDKNGDIYILSYPPAGKSKKKETYLTQIDQYDSDGRLVKTIFSQELTRYTTKLYLGNDKIFVGQAGEYFIIDKQSGLIGEFADQADKIVFSDKPYSGIKRANVPAGNYIFTDSLIYAVYSGTIKIFDGGKGNLIKTMPMNYGEIGSFLKDDKNDLIFTCPEAGQVVKIDTKGNDIKITGPEVPPDNITNVNDICCDSENNVYLVDSSNNRILVFDKNGKFVRKYSHSTIIRPTSIALDDKENLYVIGYGFQDGETARVFDKNSNLIKTINLPTGGLDMRNGNILDLVVTKDYIYLVSDRYVMKYDFNGKRISVYDTKNNDKRIVLGKDNKDNIYFAIDGKIYQYNDNNNIVYTFVKLKNESSYHGENQFSFNSKNEIITYRYETDFSAYNVENKQNKQIKLKLKPFPYGLIDKYSVDNENNIWVITTNSNQNIFKINSDGKIVTSIGKLKKYGEDIINNKAAKNKTAWKPVSVALDKHGYIYVVDRVNNAIIKFTAEGKLVSQVDMEKYNIRASKIRIDLNNNCYIWEDLYDSKRLLSVNINELF